MKQTTIIDPSSGVLVAQIVEKTVAAIVHNWHQSKPAHIVLTGGRTGKQIAETLDTEIFRVLQSEPFLNTAQLLAPGALGLHIWFSDERFVESTDPDRIDNVLIPCFEKISKMNEVGLHFHKIPTPETVNVDGAAELYARELDDVLGDLRFDAVILSIGEDGHVASLFPGLPYTERHTQSAVPVHHSPKPPSQRVSIGLDRLAKANAIYIFALGESKREALINVLNGEETPVTMILSAATVGEMIIATDLK